MRAYFFFLPQYQQAMSGFGFLISEEGSVLFYNSLRFLMVLVHTPNYLEMTTLDEGGRGVLLGKKRTFRQLPRHNNRANEVMNLVR